MHFEWQHRCGRRQGNGGGLYNQGMTTLINCTLSGNDAAHGGGLDNGGLNIGGGAIAALNGCTVSGNTAVGSGGLGNYGGGLYNFIGDSMALTNTIVAGNGDGGAASDIAGAGTASGSYDLIGTGGSGGLMSGVDHNIVGVAAPMVGTLGNYGGPTQTIPLLPGSPAIGGGTASGAATDQRGQPRPGTSTSAPSRARASPSPPSPAAARRRPHPGRRSRTRWR